MIKSISVVVPMYNEARRIAPHLEELLVYLRRGKNKSYIKEIILVDDGSLDATVEVCGWYINKFAGLVDFKIIRLEKNKGKWAAIRTGMLMACNEHTLILDADGSASIFNLDRLNLNTVTNSVFGTRFAKQSIVDNKAFIRTVVSIGYRIYIRVVYWLASGKTDVSDMQCPWKLVPRNISLKLHVNRFAGDLEVALMSRKVHNLPINFFHMAGSKVSISSSFEMAKDALIVGWRYRKIQSGKRK